MKPKRTPSNDVFTRVVLEIFRLNGVLLQNGNQLSQPFGLSSARWQVIGAVDFADTPLSVAQIARRMGLSRQGVQRVVNDLEEVGMVQLVENTRHKRARLVTITSSGQDILRRLNAAQAEWAQEMCNGLSTDELAEVLETLVLLRKRGELAKLDK